MPIIRLTDGLVERLVLDVVQPAAVQRARGDRRSVAGRDELGEEVMCLLAVRDAGEQPVLPFDEHAGEDEHMHQKPRLTLGKPEPHEGADPRGTDAVAEARRDGLHHMKSSATRGSNPRPPLRPLPPPRP
jgi:hypothetical protein